MSIAAWPSIKPAIPRSAFTRASRTSRSRNVSRNSTAISTIMIGPPVNSAKVNCQPMSRARITPSSITRLVEAISNAIAAVKLAPFRNKDRASATEAYERGPPDQGLDYRRQPEPEDQRPGDLPGHRPGDGQRVHDGADQAHLRGRPSPESYPRRVYGGHMGASTDHDRHYGH